MRNHPTLKMKCSAEAKRTFQDLQREYEAEVIRLQLKIEMGVSDYKSYYSAKVNDVWC
jgi:hypothetical protein